MLTLHMADQDIYDSYPGSDDYIKGFAIQVFVPFKQKDVTNLQRFLHNPDMNVYAYIPTDYAGAIDEVCGVAYVILASKFELTIAEQKMLNLKNGGFRITHKVVSRKMIWFHKAWKRKEYDPTRYDTDTKKYLFIRHRRALYPVLGEKETKRLRKAWAKDTKECYEPRSPQDEICKNSKISGRYNSPCLRCPVSHVSDRYNSWGRCIIRKKDMV